MWAEWLLTLALLRMSFLSSFISCNVRSPSRAGSNRYLSRFGILMSTHSCTCTHAHVHTHTHTHWCTHTNSHLRSAVVISSSSSFLLNRLNLFTILVASSSSLTPRSTLSYKFDQYTSAFLSFTKPCEEHYCNASNIGLIPNISWIAIIDLWSTQPKVFSMSIYLNLIYNYKYLHAMQTYKIQSKIPIQYY